MARAWGISPADMGGVSLAEYAAMIDQLVLEAGHRETQATGRRRRRRR